MRIQRYFTSKNQTLYHALDFRTMTYQGSSFQLPARWSSQAAQAFIQNYFYKSPLPTHTSFFYEEGTPEWLCSKTITDPQEETYERDARQVLHRLAGTWSYGGWKGNYFKQEEDAKAFYEEMCTMLATQRAVPFSSSWLATTLRWAYGLPTSLQGLATSTPASTPSTPGVVDYSFLNDEPCYLASLNLETFYHQGQFDLEGFKHAVRLWTMALDISVSMTSCEQEALLERSFKFRTLGLGYTNLGGLLMAMGVPYESSSAQAIAQALTAIMTGVAYGTSAEMAKKLGTFSSYNLNQDLMLATLTSQRQAAYGKTVATHHRLALPETIAQKTELYTLLRQSARESWDHALALGKKNGYRNTQTTALTFTEVVSAVMDCEAHGLDSSIPLVRFEAQPEGGYKKSVSSSVLKGLESLGYSAASIQSIRTYVVGHQTLEGAPFISFQVLKEKGFTDKGLKKLKEALAHTLDLRFAFNQENLSSESDFCPQTAGFSADMLADPKFNLLQQLGFSEEQVQAANLYCCGAMTLQGAPYLKEEHFPVFSHLTFYGESIQKLRGAEDDIRMIKTVQGFVSGSVSQTVSVSQGEVALDLKSIYALSWNLGLKCNDLYKQNRHLAPPASLRTTTPLSAPPAATQPCANLTAAAAPKDTAAPISARHKLPSRRKGYTQKAVVGGHKVYLRTGEYENGALGEIFIDMHKEGAAFRSLMNSFAMAISIGLQYGVPLEEYVDAFSFTRFEPWGPVKGNDAIKNATSILDYIFRELAISYLGRTDLAHTDPSDLVPGTIGDAGRDYTATPSASTWMDSYSPVASTGFVRSNLYVLPTSKGEGNETLNTPMGGTTLVSNAAGKTSSSSEAETIRLARQQGYEGKSCRECGNFTLMADASSLKCVTCGDTSLISEKAEVSC